jgi:hypothetical protein
MVPTVVREPSTTDTMERTSSADPWYSVTYNLPVTGSLAIPRGPSPPPDLRSTLSAKRGSSIEEDSP